MTQCPKINADFAVRVVVRPENYQWTPSPMPGVDRVMLDRIGGEVARATSIVRYAPNTRFSRHTHGGGEEFLVLKGIFADEHGQYPQGTYVRNPIGTAHTPSVAEAGATILVKLHQFDANDSEQKVIDTHTARWNPSLAEGIAILPLHEYQRERVALMRWAPNANVQLQYKTHEHQGGKEIFVLEGTLYDEYGAYSKGSWLRYVHLNQHTFYTKDTGALVFVKTGHLPL